VDVFLTARVNKPYGLNNQDSCAAKVTKCRGGRSEATGCFGKNAVGDDQVTGGEVQQ